MSSSAEAVGPLPSGTPLTISSPNYFELCSTADFTVGGGTPPYTLVFSYFGHQQSQVKLGSGNSTYTWNINILPGIPIQVTANDSGTVQQTVSTDLFTTSPNTHQILCALEDVGPLSVFSSIAPPAAFTGSVTATASAFGFQTSPSGASTTSANQSGSPSSSNPSPPNDTNDHRTSGKTIGFIVLGVVLGLLAICAIVLLILRRRRKKLTQSIDLLDDKPSEDIEEPLPEVTPFSIDERTLVSASRSQEQTFERPDLAAHTSSTDRVSSWSGKQNNKRTVMKRKVGAASASATTPESSELLGDTSAGEEPSTMKQIDDASILPVSRPEDSGHSEVEGSSGRRREADAGIRLAGEEWADDNETLPPAYADIRR